MNTQKLEEVAAEMKGMVEYVKANSRPGRSQAETDSWAAEYEKQLGLLASGYSVVVTLRRGMSTVYGPKVDAVSVHGFRGGNSYAVRTMDDAQLLADHDDAKNRSAASAYVPFEQRREVAATEAMIRAEQNAPAGATDEEIDEIGQEAFDAEYEDFVG